MTSFSDQVAALRRRAGSDAYVEGRECAVRASYEDPLVAHGDFYLVASAVLPILVFADTLQGKQPTFYLRSEPVVERLQRHVPLVLILGGLTWWPFYVWSEWISIRSLEIGRSAFGGTTVVWLALTFAFVQLAGTDIAARVAGLTEARATASASTEPAADE